MVLDPDVLFRLERAAGEADPTLVRELIVEFEERSRPRMGRLYELVAAGDLAAAAREAHSFAGSAGLLGLTELCGSLRALEDAAREDAAGATLVDLARGALERALAALAAWSAARDASP